MNLLLDLPHDVLVKVLVHLDGRSLSTCLFIKGIACKVIYDTVQHRCRQYESRLSHVTSLEVPLWPPHGRQSCRNGHSSTDLHEAGPEGDYYLPPWGAGMVQKLSEYCALIDYIDQSLAKGSWMVYSGWLFLPQLSSDDEGTPTTVVKEIQVVLYTMTFQPEILYICQDAFWSPENCDAVYSNDRGLRQALEETSNPIAIVEDRWPTFSHGFPDSRYGGLFFGNTMYSFSSLESPPLVYMGYVDRLLAFANEHTRERIKAYHSEFSRKNRGVWTVAIFRIHDGYLPARYRETLAGIVADMMNAHLDRKRPRNYGSVG